MAPFRSGVDASRSGLSACRAVRFQNTGRNKAINLRRVQTENVMRDVAGMLALTGCGPGYFRRKVLGGVAIPLHQDGIKAGLDNYLYEVTAQQMRITKEVRRP